MQGPARRSEENLPNLGGRSKVKRDSGRAAFPRTSGQGRKTSPCSSLQRFLNFSLGMSPQSLPSRIASRAEAAAGTLNLTVRECRAAPNSGASLLEAGSYQCLRGPVSLLLHSLKAASSEKTGFLPLVCKSC